MAVNDELGKRMKEFYEGIPKTKLMRRTPVIIRIDGRSFHSFTKGLKKPFDHVLMASLQETMKYLCENIQGAVLGYHQSDEISILLIDYKRFNSSAFFDYEIQKVCSISASMATVAFNRFFYRISQSEVETTNDDKYKEILLNKQDLMPQFDARCFNIPKEEVTNYFYWRQLDAIRNSIEMLGQANFSSKQLHKKRCEEIKNMLIDEKNIYWNALPLHKQRGTCCIKATMETDEVTRSKWIIDAEIPIFKGQERSYVEDLMPKG